MPALAAAIKIAVPVVLAAGGVVAAVAVPESAPAASLQLWVDSPSDGARLQPGLVTVVAHAADGSGLTSMGLEVDGVEVDRQTRLARFDLLAGVELTWEATEGRHFLVVTGGGLRSSRVAVDVATTELGTPGRAPGPAASATPTATPTASADPSESSSPTPTPSPTEAATPRTSEASTPSPKPTPQPVDPVVGKVSVSPSPVSGNACTGDVVVRAMATGATDGSAVVTGSYGVDTNIGGTVVGGVFTARFRQRDLVGQNVSGDFRVEVTVTNATGFDVGAASFQIFCSKD